MRGDVHAPAQEKTVFGIQSDERGLGAAAFDMPAISCSAFHRIRAIESQMTPIGVQQFSPDSMDDFIRRHSIYLSLPTALAEGYGLQYTTEFYSAEAYVFFMYRFAMYLDEAIDENRPMQFIPAFSYWTMAQQIISAVSNESPLSILKSIGLFSRLEATLRTVEEERFLMRNQAARTQERFTKIAAQKCALAHLAPSIMRAAAGHADSNHIEAAQRNALDHIHVGMQWVDDVIDLRKDLATNQPSLLRERIQAHSSGDIDHRQFAYQHGLVAQNLNDASREFDEAEAALSEIPSVGMRTIISKLRNIHAEAMGSI